MKLSEMQINEEKTISKINCANNSEVHILYSLGVQKNQKIKYLNRAPFFGSRAFLVNGNIISIPTKKCALIEVV